MNASAFRDLWAQVFFENCNLKTFQNITSDHKSRNSREGHVIFFLLYPQQNHSVTVLSTPWVHIT